MLSKYRVVHQPSLVAWAASAEGNTCGCGLPRTTVAWSAQRTEVSCKCRTSSVENVAGDENDWDPD